MSIFKSCDIRGIYGQDLDETTAWRLGRAVGTRVPGKQVVVAGDLRTSTPALMDALTAGLLSSGADVVQLGQVPTPVLYFAKRRSGFAAGIMVTASHNPPQYNGFKLMLGHLPITPSEIEALALEMETGQFASGSGTRQEMDILDDYASPLRSHFCGINSHRLVVDCGNGSMSTVAPDLLRALGMDVVALYCTPDGRFPNRDPNPAVPEHLTSLCQAVVEHNAELGMAFDGDGDRVIFVDGRGRVQPADRTLVLLLRDIVPRNRPALVVYDLKSSSIVAEETLALGGRPLCERSGHAFIKRRLLIEDAVLGGEVSGHYFFRERGGDDALYATLALLRALDHLETTFTQAIDTVPRYPITPDIRLPAPPELARQVLAELQAAFADYPIDRLDGVRVEFPAGWALARLSVTEPLITLRFEAHTETDLDRIQERVRLASPTLAEIMRNTPGHNAR